MAVRVARTAEAIGASLARALLIASAALALCGLAAAPGLSADPVPAGTAAPSGTDAPGSAAAPGGAVTPTAQPEPAPPSLSPSCEAPATEIAIPEPLPHVQEKLQARSRIKVLAIGSSSTVGVGASRPSLNYPAQLEEILEKTFKGLDVVVINRGVSGEVASATAERLKTLVALVNPDLVLWQVGTNDALSHIPVEDFAETVRSTLRWLKEHDIDTALVGLQYTLKVSQDPYYASIRQALRDIAASEKVLLVRRYEAMQFIEQVAHNELVSPDDLHLNDLGYRCMAEHIARAVVVSAFVRGKGARRKI